MVLGANEFEALFKSALANLVYVAIEFEAYFTMNFAENLG